MSKPKITPQPTTELGELLGTEDRGQHPARARELVQMAQAPVLTIDSQGNPVAFATAHQLLDAGRAALIQQETAAKAEQTKAAYSGALTNAPVMIEMDLACRTTGGSGTVMGQGRMLVNDTATMTFPILTAAVTVDTTASALLDVTAQWNTASAGETITITNVSIEALT